MIGEKTRMTQKRLIQLLTDEICLDYCKHLKTEYKVLEEYGFVVCMMGFVFVTELGENFLDTLSWNTDNT